MVIDGYYALIRAICQDISIDEAVEIECGPAPKRRGKPRKIDVPTQEVIRLRQAGLTWKMLGEKYGVNPKTLEQHIRRYRKAVGI